MIGRYLVMFIEITDTNSIRGINTNRDIDGFYLLEVVFDNGHVMVYGFPTLKEFIVNYTEFMNKYRRS
jgi:hypothetical protein